MAHLPSNNSFARTFTKKEEHKAVSTSERINLKMNIQRKLFAQLAEITVVARSNYWISELHSFSQDSKAFSLQMGIMEVGIF